MSTTKNPPTEAGKDPKKTADLPPYGPRNADPLTGAPGSHPIETGVGAVIGGVASGLALGAVGGPLGAIAGAIAGGAVAGGLAGKGVGELIDPTTEDNWIRDLIKGRPDRTAKWEEEAREAYRFGWHAEGRYVGRTFAQAEAKMEDEWRAVHPSRPWAGNRMHVRDGFEKGREVNGTAPEQG